MWRLGQFILLALITFHLWCALSAAAGETRVPVPEGVWDGSIQTSAGEVNFGIEVKLRGDLISAVVVNSTDRQAFSSATWDGAVLTLRLDYYDGTLTTHFVSRQKMEGEYSRQTRKGLVHIPVALVPHREAVPGKAWTGPTLAGDWLFVRPGTAGEDKVTLATFQQKAAATTDGKVLATGILEPVSGDTGLLHGSVYVDAGGHTHFHLSRFDGIHVLALDGDFQPDGSLKGQLAGTASSVAFSAHRSKDLTSADPNAQAGSLTRVKDPRQPFRFTGVDLSGKVIDQSSAQFKDKAVIVDIFGTWCPNCHDEAPILEQLYRKYHSQGLEIVGLAYEYTDDSARNLRQIGIYRAKHGITFSLLMAGTTDEGQIEKTLPQLVNFGAYPTTIFLDRSGHLHAIHAGFAGPSTGDKYQEVQQRMDQLTREILGTAN
ncbi:MAG: TlpA disulfide reductase family protein [Candidatus Korobacteraceae bacterium]